MKKIIMLGMVLIVMCSFLLLPTSVFGASSEPLYTGTVTFPANLNEKKYYLNKYSSNDVYIDFNIHMNAYLKYSSNNITKAQYDIAYAEFSTLSVINFLPEENIYIQPLVNGFDKGGPVFENGVGFFCYSIDLVFNSSILFSSLDTGKNPLSSSGSVFDISTINPDSNIYYSFLPDCFYFDGFEAYLSLFHVSSYTVEYTVRFSRAYSARGFALGFDSQFSIPEDGLSFFSGANAPLTQPSNTKIIVDDKYISTFESSKHKNLFYIFDNNAEVTFNKIKFTTVFNCPFWYFSDGSFPSISYLSIKFLNFITESNVAENTGILGFNQNYIDCTWYDIPCHLGNALVYLLYNFPLTAGIFSLFKTIFGLISSTITLLISFSGLGVLFVIFIIFFILRLARWLTG